MTELEQLEKLKDNLLADADKMAETLSKADKELNCKNIEWNPVSNDEHGTIGLYYVPLCLKRQEVIIDPTGCKSCKFKEDKFNAEGELN